MERKLFLYLILHAFVQNLKSKMNPDYNKTVMLKKKSKQTTKQKIKVKPMIK